MDKSRYVTARMPFRPRLIHQRRNLSCNQPHAAQPAYTTLSFQPSIANSSQPTNMETGTNIQRQSKLMDKWSSKPADYNALRVRENQRRHRARVKSRIEDLESCLEETNARLEAAITTIDGLHSELEALRRQPRSQSPGRSSCIGTPSFRASFAQEATLTATVQAGPAGAVLLPSELAEQHAVSISSRTSQEFDSLGGEPIAAAPELAGGDRTDCNCEGFPPPAPGESTVLCSSAFQIIEQQNFSGTEVTTIRAWLSPGFRKGLRSGETCRVETNRLYELLDHITT